MTDSSTGGYLTPTSPPPLEDASLDAFLQAFVVGVTGIPGQFVRPRWQVPVPKHPESTVDWCAIGVTSTAPEYDVYDKHHPDGNGFDEVIRQEVLEIQASFYGPNASLNARIFRDGLAVPQNREAMYFQQMNLVSTDCKLVFAPELINETWFRRMDMTFYVRRAVDRQYAVLNLLEAVGTIEGDNGETEPFQAGP